MKQGPITLILVGVFALVVSLISSNKIVKEQTIKAKRQALSIKRSERLKKTENKQHSDSGKKFKLGVLRESGR